MSATVKRSAWSRTPSPTISSYRARPGRIGSPAASAEVQPSGRSALDGQIEDGPRARVPGAVRLLVRVVELVELLVVGVEHQHVSVAVVVGTAGALHRGVRRHGIRPGVALVAVVGEVDRHLRLRPRDRDVGDADARALPHGAEVRVQAGRGTHVRDVVARSSRRAAACRPACSRGCRPAAGGTGWRRRRRRRPPATAPRGEREQEGRREPAGERGGPGGGRKSMRG